MGRHLEEHKKMFEKGMNKEGTSKFFVFLKTILGWMKEKD